MSTVFLLLLIYSIGTAWAAFLPRASWVENTRFSRLAPVLNWINPGEFRVKEVIVFHTHQNCMFDRWCSTSSRLSLLPRRLTEVVQSTTSPYKR